ncbi:MAG: hypothetical protein A2506_03245 [Elusimicrobia bacterium RIFOXYD12_FULL_66_9]|nr:MAG: hypothetical protein A2506_03245 [Elusimicrobia bacterium RIFOXYD12_FULL_66_9]
MAFFEWGAQYETGIAVIDAQHKKLVELTNTLAETSAGKTPNELEVLNRSMVELADYIQVHFGAEEDLLARNHYPDAEGHIRDHREFERDFKNLLQEAMSGQMLGVAPLLEFLKPWLTQHILQSDRRYVPYVKEIS